MTTAVFLSLFIDMFLAIVLGGLALFALHRINESLKSERRTASEIEGEE